MFRLISSRFSSKDPLREAAAPSHHISKCFVLFQAVILQKQYTQPVAVCYNLVIAHMYYNLFKAATTMPPSGENVQRRYKNVC